MSKHVNIHEGAIEVNGVHFVVAVCDCEAWGMGFNKLYGLAKLAAVANLMDNRCTRAHSTNCKETPALISGDLLQQAGIEGGEMMFCPACRWYGRPIVENSEESSSPEPRPRPEPSEHRDGLDIAKSTP